MKYHRCSIQVKFDCRIRSRELTFSLFAHFVSHSEFLFGNIRELYKILHRSKNPNMAHEYTPKYLSVRF